MKSLFLITGQRNDHVHLGRSTLKTLIRVVDVGYLGRTDAGLVEDLCKRELMRGLRSRSEIKWRPGSERAECTGGTVHGSVPDSLPTGAGLAN
jgi:hypothetical protein